MLPKSDLAGPVFCVQAEPTDDEERISSDDDPDANVADSLAKLSVATGRYLIENNAKPNE